MAENHTTDTTFSSLPIHEAIQEALEDHRLTHTTKVSTAIAMTIGTK